MSKKNNYRFRIVNKSKDGVTISTSRTNQTKLTWQEFNNQFDIDGLYWAQMKPESIELYEKIEEKLNELVVATVMSKSKDVAGTTKELVYLSQIGALTEEITEISGFSVAQVISQVRLRLNNIGWNGGYGKSKCEDTYESSEDSSVEVTRTPKTTLGDLPEFQKLKDTIQSEEA